MAITTAKPGSVGSANNPGGGLIGREGTVFKIKMAGFDSDVWSPVQETTGDGDASPFFENSGLGYCRLTVQGHMVPNQAIGLTNLTTGSNPMADVDFLLTPNRKIRAKVLVERVRVRWRRTAATVPVIIRVIATDTLLSNLEASV